ncbi:uncharacterized protein LOC133309124 [Gastrolobium bilobum]|uniref:uncharacterized protein LOC133309124 n=1 Tax=Gastrolobium bilobum TaxID=150636 RepID=UPI002AB0940D|nr:uncharacterized protein LOC133309124 [Gastrolobium bilobum]
MSNDEIEFETPSRKRRNQGRIESNQLTDSKNARLRRKGIMVQKKTSETCVTSQDIPRMLHLTENLSPLSSVHHWQITSERNEFTCSRQHLHDITNENLTSLTPSFVGSAYENNKHTLSSVRSTIAKDDIHSPPTEENLSPLSASTIGSLTHITSERNEFTCSRQHLRDITNENLTPLTPSTVGSAYGNNKHTLSNVRSTIAKDYIHSLPMEVGQNATIRRKGLMFQKKASKQCVAINDILKMLDLTDSEINDRNMPDITSTSEDIEINNSNVPSTTSNNEEYWDAGDPTFVCDHCGANMCSTSTEDKLDPEIILSLKQMLDKHNSIAQSFRCARDRYKEYDFNGVKLRLIRKRGSDGRVYNLSTASEVAALIVGDIDSAICDRDIIIETQDRVLQRIDVKHPLYLGLQYPLLFPYGEDGYHDDVQRTVMSSGRTNARAVISMKEFFSFRLTDAIRRSHLRAELYKNIKHSFDRGEDVAVNTGKRIIIPTSFTGRPRYMVENCKDAFAICRWAGYPHLFITITCNPKWPEITRVVRARQLSPEDRPDILCRVFKFKLDELLHDLRKQNVLGKVIAYVCTIEFQKRGLPHADILLFFHPSNKPKSALDIDKLISAKIPDKDSNPLLFQAVTNYMIHGPCGPENYKSPCMKDGQCSKIFPKNLCSRSSIDDDGFPHYKRRNDARVVNKNGVELDNRNDRVTAAVHHAEDEIKMFYNCRYVSACEAAWRIFGFDIHSSDNALISDVKTRAESRLSIFESWMDANKKYLEGRHLTYAKYPTEFVYKDQTHEWNPRKMGFSIGRINRFSANNGEDSYLCTLLTFQRGCTSYEDLRTINGVLFPTFKDVCYSLGLLDDDNEYIDAIKEASSWGSAAYLRSLFAVLLFSNSMNRPEKVWEECWKFLSNDVLYRHRKRIGRQDALLTEERIKNITLAEIDKVLQSNGKCLSDYPSMPRITRESLLDMQNRLVVDELMYDTFSLGEEHERLLNSLTDEHRVVYDKIILAVTAGKVGLFFLYGFGGTGKKFIWNTLSASVRSKAEIVLNVASSGIASLLLSGGRTSHSRFRIPIHINEDSTCNIKPNSTIAELLSKTKLIIWDEAPMVHRFCFEALDKTLRDVLRFSDTSYVDIPFGGKIVVLGGDFRQILPSHSSWQQTGDSKYPTFFKERAILTPKLSDVAMLNEHLMSMIPGEERIFLSSDKIMKQDVASSVEDDEFTPEILNTLLCSGIPDHKLTLKVKVPVMLLRNIDQFRVIHSSEDEG